MSITRCNRCDRPVDTDLENSTTDTDGTSEICDNCLTEDEILWEDGAVVDTGEATKANADLIVRAVNNHGKLVEALEKIKKKIQTNTNDATSANLVLAAINRTAQTALDAARGKA